jgi:putative Ig domain-containing protein
MRTWITALSTGVACLFAATATRAATIVVPAGGDLQAALDAARPGDVITLEPNATYTGNFVLPNKGDTSVYITIRSAAPDSMFPDAGVRMTPVYAPHLPKIKSPNSTSALQTAVAAHHYKLMFLEFQANLNGAGDIISIGAGDATQTQLPEVPYAFVLDRLYVHGDPELGQKRGIALHSRDTTVMNSWVSDCKAINQESQALSGFNGPGNYLIENNYLEAATQSFLLGGADPPIPNLVTTNVVFRYNHLSKPLAWRDPILAAPPTVTAVATPAAGVLTAGTYYYKVVARKLSNQNRIATSVASSEASATLDVDGAVTISWTPVAGAQEYLVYGRTSNSQTLFWTTPDPFFTDTGAAGAAGKPGNGTKWVVKNIFELKNAQDVLVEGNVFENLWVADQSGYPIVFTPRNQNGRAPWVVVQNVMFRNNIVRHTAGGVNILGTDNLAPSQRTNHITIVDNLFEDLTASIWGATKVFLIGDGPDHVTIDHNTIISTQSSIYYLYGGPLAAPTPITNLTITNNVSAHNSFGLFGDRFSFGLKAFNAYMLPKGIFCRNVLAGGNAKVYVGLPCGGVDNLFPTVADWQREFVDFAGGDYHLRPPDSTYKNAGVLVDDQTVIGPDGKDLGSDLDVVLAESALALSGDVRLLPGMPQVHISQTTLPNGMYNVPYQQSVSCSGGRVGCAIEVLDSSLPDGLVFDARSGLIKGVPAEPTTGLLNLRAYDTTWDFNDATRLLQITVDPPPLLVTMPEIPNVKVGEPFHLAPSVSGTLGSVTWNVVSGDLPAGLNLDLFSGEIAGTPTMWGTTSATVQAKDSDRWGLNRVVSDTVSITVAPAPIQIAISALPGGVYHSSYQATLSATGGTGSFKWSVTSGEVPPGLLVDASGLVTGEPQCIGSFTMHVDATDTKWPGYTNAGTVSLDIVPTPFSVSLPAVPAGVVGFRYSLSASAAGQAGTITWSASGLPPGLTVAATGTIAGIPTAFGIFTTMLQAQDSYSTCGTAAATVTRTADVRVIVAIAPLPLVIQTTTLPPGRVRQPYHAPLEFTGGTGTTTWSVVDGQLPRGVTLSSAGSISGKPTEVGTFSFTLQASDVGWAGNVAARPFSVRIRAREVVLYASDANVITGTWSLMPDATAAGGSRIWSPNKSAGKNDEPLANPANYFEIPFQAEAGVAYHLWVRGRGDKDKRVNDAVMVQFSGSVAAAGAPAYRIGTTSATDVNLADCNGCHLSGWGWQDNGWGVSVMGPVISFEQSGAQTIRVQVKQDGFSIDQIVLSAEKFLTIAPGALKNDATIVSR